MVVVTAPVPTVAAAVVASTIVVGGVEAVPIAAAVVEADPTVAAAVVASTRSVVLPVAGQQPQHALHELYDHCGCAARYTEPPALPQPQ